MKHLHSERTSGVNEHTFFDSGTGNIHTRSIVDLTNLFDKNQYEKNHGNNGFTKEGDMRKIAEIDMVTVMRLKTEFNIDVYKNEDMPRLKKWLKENNKFMTVTGGI